ncbi:MAG: FAD-binding dehydrogenase, partial [Proteobacteria bacterium]
MSDIDYLIIGAGVSGLALGGDLQAAGKQVVLVDKGRILGGRCTTKNLPSGTLVDYGAQFFTAKGERFVAWTDSWLNEGDSDLAIWNHGIPVYSNGAIQKRESGHPRYAPKSGMNVLPQRLARELHVRTSTTITSLQKIADGWRVEGHTYPGEIPVSFRAKNICLTIPPEQLVSLAGEYFSEEACESLEAVAYDPAWTVIAPLAHDIQHDFPALEFKDHLLLNWISRDHT